MLTVKGEGIICVFVPVFVIDGDLIADFNDVGWTEAWETPPRHRYLGKSPCHIGPTLLHPMVRITRGTVKHELTSFLIPYDTGGVEAEAISTYMNFFNVLKCPYSLQICTK